MAMAIYPPLKDGVMGVEWRRAVYDYYHPLMVNARDTGVWAHSAGTTSTAESSTNRITPDGLIIKKNRKQRRRDAKHAHHRRR